MKKKYYLVNYIFQPEKGTAVYPNLCEMFEFPIEKSPKECYDEIHENLNKGGESEFSFNKYYCSIIDMKLIV